MTGETQKELKKQLDQATKESQSLQKTPEYKAQKAAELAAMCRDFRGVTLEKPRGNMPASRAAQMLGIPIRTYQGIENGRGFPYPILLAHAIRSFG